MSAPSRVVALLPLDRPVAELAKLLEAISALYPPVHVSASKRRVATVDIDEDGTHLIVAQVETWT